MIPSDPGHIHPKHPFSSPHMRLFTHNFLQCHAKKCTASGQNYPLLISLLPPSLDDSLERVVHKEQEFNEPFIRNQLHKIEWTVLIQAAKECGVEHELPEERPEAPYSESLLREIHRLLLETYVINGSMQCKSCKHVFPIKQGIPNMLLHADEL